MDACTIYVQNVPSNSTNDAISKLFSAYGTVDYVSLPKYTNSRQLKGMSHPLDPPSHLILGKKGQKIDLVYFFKIDEIYVYPELLTYVLICIKRP